MTEPFWRPSAAAIANANMTKFRAPRRTGLERCSLHRHRVALALVGDGD